MHPLRLHLVPAEGSVRQSSDKRAREHTTISIFNTLLEWDVELGKRSGLPARSLSHFLRLLSVQGRSGIRSELKMQLKRWKQTSFSDRIQILFSIPPFILPVQHRHQRHHNFLLLLEFCNNSNSTEPIPFQKAIYIFCLSPSPCTLNRTCCWYSFHLVYKKQKKNWNSVFWWVENWCVYVGGGVPFSHSDSMQRVYNFCFLN